MLDKSQLRKKIQLQRQQLSMLTQQRASSEIMKTVSELVIARGSKHVALYCAAQGEVLTAELISLLLSHRISVYLPVMVKERLFFYAHQGEVLKENRYGIAEPITAGRSPCDLNVIELMVLPLMAFDLAGWRIGRGGGYYDRVLAEASSSMVRVGVGYAFQQIADCEPLPHDQRLDYAVTETQCYDW